MVAAFLLAVAAVLILLVLDRSTSQLDPAWEERRALASEARPQPAILERSEVERRAGVVRIEDELTGEFLRLGVELIHTPERSTFFQSDDQVEFEIVAGTERLRYDLLGTPGFEVLAAGRMRWEEGEWIVRIPYYAGLVINVPPEVADTIDARDTLGVFIQPDLIEAEEEPQPGSINELFGRGLNRSTLAGTMNRLLRSRGATELIRRPCADQSIPELLVPALGHYVVGLARINGENGYAPIRLEPGKRTEVFLEVRRRPVLRGVLLDWNSNPVPNTQIITTTWLDLEDYDLGPNDPCGLVALRREGVVYQCTKGQVVTDDQGRFEATTPLGHHYALECNALGSRAFWNTLHNPAALHGDEEIELLLVEPGPESWVEIEVLKAGGAPFSEGQVVVGIGSDIPFIRQWPYLELDEQGTVRVLGWEIGDLVVVSPKHASLRGGLYASRPMTVPPSRRLTMVVPSGAFLDT